MIIILFTIIQTIDILTIIIIKILIYYNFLDMRKWNKIKMDK